MTATARYLGIPALALAASCTRLPPDAVTRPAIGPEPAPRFALALATAGTTPYVIAVAESASAPERNAATELATYLKQITGAEFALVAPAAVVGKPVIAVGPGAAKALAPDLDLTRLGDPGLGDDGIVLKTVGQNLVLTGAEGAKRGTLYAVYEFLERECGVRWWTQAAELVPSTPELAVRRLDLRYRPVFGYRDACYTYLTGGKSHVGRARFLVRQRFNGHFQEIPADWGGSYHIIGWCHTFEGLMPPAKYFRDHPDWYSEVAGQRVDKDTQLCCTNDEMIAELTKLVLERIRKQPDAGIIDVSQNDSPARVCQCARCRAMNEAEGSCAGPLLYCVNKVAEAVEKEYPEFLVETIAYQETLKPPRTIRPRRNVLIRFAPDGRSMLQPLDGKLNQRHMDNLRAWQAVAPQLFIWDYVANIFQPYAPHPSLPVYVPDLRTYAACNGRGVFFEGNHYAGAILGDFDELKTYVMSQSMWDPHVDEERVIDEFLNGYYGKAGPVLRQYLALLADKGKDATSTCWPPNQNPGWLDLEAMNRLTVLFDQAQAAVADDPELLKRVRIARLQLDHHWLHGYRMYKAQVGAGGVFNGPGDLNAALADFLARATAVAGSEHLNWTCGPKDYDRLLARRVAPVVGAVSLPAALAGVPAAHVVDIQDVDLGLVGGSTLVEDTLASDGWAARLGAGIAGRPVEVVNWALLGVGGRCHVYAVVRVEKVNDTGLAFVAGVHDDEGNKDMARLSVRLEEQGRPLAGGGNATAQAAGNADGCVSDGQYRLYDLGVHELRDHTRVWVGSEGVSPENAKAIYVDRVLFVKE